MSDWVVERSDAKLGEGGLIPTQLGAGIWLFLMQLLDSRIRQRSYRQSYVYKVAYFKASFERLLHFLKFYVMQYDRAKWQYIANFYALYWSRRADSANGITYAHLLSTTSSSISYSLKYCPRTGISITRFRTAINYSLLPFLSFLSCAYSENGLTIYAQIQRQKMVLELTARNIMHSFGSLLLTSKLSLCSLVCCFIDV